MQVKNSKYDIAVNAVCILLLVGIVLFLILNWGKIPDQVPGHYDGDGIVDRWGSKAELWFLPVVSWILYIGLSVLERNPKLWNTGVTVTEENAGRVYRVLKNLIVTEKLLMTVDFVWMTANSAYAIALPVWFLPVFLLLTFGSAVFFIVRLFQVK